MSSPSNKALQSFWSAGGYHPNKRYPEGIKLGEIDPVVSGDAGIRRLRLVPLEREKDLLFSYSLIYTRRRLTFDIHYQDPRWFGTEDNRIKFTASNGVEIITQSQMDIQTDRLWLLGEKGHTRSGSMVFSDDIKRNIMAARFQAALRELYMLVGDCDSVREVLDGHGGVKLYVGS